MSDRSLSVNSQVSNLLSELEGQLKLIYGDKLKKILLYGSYARNDQDPDSDMDIMILLDMNNEEIKKKRSQILDVNVELTTRFGIVISIIENNYDFFNEWLEVLPFFKNVISEGVEIYGR